MAIDKITLQNVRLSFPKLIEPSAAAQGAAPKFSADFILDPKHPDLAKFMAEVGKLAVESWKDKASAILGMVQNERKLRCYGQGSEKVNGKTFLPYDGYGDGMLYISANSNADRPPIMVRPNGVPVEASNTIERIDIARKLYGGCFVNAVVRPWAQDNQFGKAIRCELIALQFLKDGVPFGEGSADVTGMFGAVVTDPIQQSAPASQFPGLPGFLS